MAKGHARASRRASGADGRKRAEDIARNLSDRFAGSRDVRDRRDGRDERRRRGWRFRCEARGTSSSTRTDVRRRPAVDASGVAGVEAVRGRGIDLFPSFAGGVRASVTASDASTGG